MGSKPEMNLLFGEIRYIGFFIPPPPSAEYLRYHATLERLSSAYHEAPLSPSDVSEIEAAIRELPLDDGDRENFSLNMKNAPRSNVNA
jgi:cobalamin biosynthesis Mg chelatase CobN